MRTFEKIMVMFGVIVFITFMCNHGHMDFSGVDFVRDKTIEVVKSDEGQQYIKETKEISKSVFHDLFYGLKHFLLGNEDEDKESEEAATLKAATLLYCLDGDTIKVDLDGNEVTVRLIGIDTPESVNPDESKNNEYGKMASDYTKKLLENVETVYLEYDLEQTDQYGRTLAYVWLTDNTNDIENYMLNAILVKNGYADDVVYMPNIKYADKFMELKNTAMENNEGLWQYDGYVKLREELTQEKESL